MCLPRQWHFGPQINCPPFSTIIVKTIHCCILFHFSISMIYARATLTSRSVIHENVLSHSAPGHRKLGIVGYTIEVLQMLLIKAILVNVPQILDLTNSMRLGHHIKQFSSDRLISSCAVKADIFKLMPTVKAGA
jgi:hypothetical protein